jgi:hypothetical protein
MSHSFRYSLIILAILTGLLLAWGMVLAAPGTKTQQVIDAAQSLSNQREVASPDISFIDSPAASCELAETKYNLCYLTWSYLSVNAFPNYMITMTVSVDGKARARYSGFFQTGMYVPPEMSTIGVACNVPSSGNAPVLGATHSYTIRARDSAGLTAANYGSVTCPADLTRRIFLPLLDR